MECLEAFETMMKVVLEKSEAERMKMEELKINDVDLNAISIHINRNRKGNKE